MAHLSHDIFAARVASGRWALKVAFGVRGHVIDQTGPSASSRVRWALMNTFFKSPSTSRPGAAAPPSAFKNGTLSAPTAVAYNNPSASSSTVSLSRRHSRTNLDFEQALATDTTVHLKDSVDVNVLGAEAFATPPRRGSGADSNDFTTASSRREGRRTQAAQPSTPVVLPPTPASASKSSNKVYQHESDPTDPDFQTKRRSMFRSPGTASSPDLATLVRKAKERRGIVGSSSNADDRSRPPEFRVDGAPPVDVVQDPTSSLSGALLSPASSDQPRGRARSSTSSSYSIISTPSVQATPTRPQISSGSQMATPSPPSKLMKGKSRTTDSGTSSRSHKDDPKVCLVETYIYQRLADMLVLEGLGADENKRFLQQNAWVWQCSSS